MDGDPSTGAQEASPRQLFHPPLPPSRPEGLPFWRIWLRARRNLFSALNGRLYRAKLAEVKTPWYNSYLPNQPDLVRRVLVDEPQNFPKSGFVKATLGDLLGDGVFVTEGETWRRQRRLIDPCFEGGRLRQTFAPMLDAAEAMASRIERGIGVPQEIEATTSHAAADVICRTLFSQPITDAAAGEIFQAFRRYQLSAPMLSPADLMRVPMWFPRLGPARWRKRRAARAIRRQLRALVDQRWREVEAGTAPDDIASAIMRRSDPVTGDRFGKAEMADQLAVFFLAGHETSASALAWALYLVANTPDVQARLHAEAAGFFDGTPKFADLRGLSFTRDVLREALRLYPPVPMMVREAACPVAMRDKEIAQGSPIVISPWHLGRNERVWRDAHAFDPDRWQTDEGREAARHAFLPFSAGPRACPGAGFAMQEGVILLARLLARYRFDTVPGRLPEPMAHVTVRSANGIWLNVTAR